MSPNHSNIARAFGREFEALPDCLEATVSMLRPDDWSSGAILRQRPVHQVCHILVSLVGYMGIGTDMLRCSFRFKPTKYT